MEQRKNLPTRFLLLVIFVLFVTLALSGSAHAAGRCTIVGTGGAEELVGTARADVICAGGGGDTVIAKGGDDFVYGGTGNDVIYPGAGSDRVFAGADADLIFAADLRRDGVDGGAGADRGRIDPRLDWRARIEGLFPARRGKYPVVLAAGDIADCSRPGPRLTAPLLDAFPHATVLTLGDNAYPDGTIQEFQSCYAPTWGRAKRRTRPSPGNHDYNTPGASGYFAYFGAAAGDPAQGWYSFNLGAWHLISLNSNCAFVTGGCGPSSPQERWLRADLAAQRRRCTLAFWHHARFSSGVHGNDPTVSALWQALEDAGAELVLVGHEHSYERFAPQSGAGVPTPRGIRQIVVGTGGAGLRPFRTTAPNSVVRNDGTHGVLKLVLAPNRYAWRFVPESGKTFADAGSAACH